LTPPPPQIIRHNKNKYDGAAIRAIRKSKGWTMAQLAKAVGLSQQSICSIERQETKEPAASTMFAIAAALGVPINRIMPTVGTPIAANEFDAILGALNVNNRAALLSVAAVLLEAQKTTK